MKIKYTLSKKNYKKFLYLIQSKYDFLYLSLYSIIFFYITFYAIKQDLKVVLLCYILSTIILYVIIFLIKRLFITALLKMNDKKYKDYYGEYNIKIDEKQIVEKVNTENIIIKYNDIKKIKYTKNYIIISTKKNSNIFFIKSILNKEEDFDNLTQTLKSNYKK